MSFALQMQISRILVANEDEREPARLGGDNQSRIATVRLRDNFGDTTPNPIIKFISTLLSLHFNFHDI
jgi:hypothetical protein